MELSGFKSRRNGIKIGAYLVSAFFILIACSAPKNLSYSINQYNQSLADSLLAYALDHEALYTLADTLKPMSSVKFLSYAIAKDSSMQDGEAYVTHKDSLLQLIDQYQAVCKALSNDTWQFILVPFQRTEKNMRNLEIYVIRKAVFADKIKQYQFFFGQWGFTPNTDPAVVLSVIEFETRWDRNRAYGYLFGYPAYAVDFFVEANKMQQADVNKKIVPRNFFAIPVFAGSQGYFTYAMPKSYQPNELDSAIYRKAENTLNQYRQLRSSYLRPSGLKAQALWKQLR